MWLPTLERRGLWRTAQPRHDPSRSRAGRGGRWMHAPAWVVSFGAWCVCVCESHPVSKDHLQVLMVLNSLKQGAAVHS